MSKRQGCVSLSTPEAELVSANFAIRHCGLPGFSLWEALLGGYPNLYVHEDNQAMLRVLETGKNPTMRYLARTHRVNVAWLHEVCQNDRVILGYEESSRMCADIFTKMFSDSKLWKAARTLINVLDNNDLRLIAQQGVSTTVFPAPQSGGSCTLNIPYDDLDPYKWYTPGAEIRAVPAQTTIRVQVGDRYKMKSADEKRLYDLLCSVKWPFSARTHTST